MKLLPKEQQESYENVKTCYVFIGKFEDKYAKNMNIINLETIVIIQGNIEVLQIEYLIQSMLHLKKFL